VESTRTDEIGILASAFNSMLAALRQARKTEEEYARRLEGQVYEQTQQLQTKNAEMEAALDVLQQDIERRQKVEAELIAAKALADAANLAKAQFLANVTHELRTPLIGVLGMNELLAASPLTAAQQSLAATVQRCGESLLGIINDVLDFSKIESGGFTLEARDIEIGLLVEQTATILADQAAAKGLHLACRVEPTALWRVMADDMRLRQILLNLIGNAVKFTPQGNISVRLDMGEQTEDHGRFVFEVQDTGIGIDEEVQARIFSPFVQGDASPVREFGGTGLGLAIVRQPVKQMGGEVALESRVGSGSLFRVTIALPLVARSCPQVPEVLRGRRVLLQINHPADREILRRMLDFLDVDTVAVASGDEALQCMESADRQGHPFGLLMIDAEARLAVGTPLIERLRNESVCAPLPIIAICSRAYLLANGYPAGMVSLEVPVGWHALAIAVGAEWLCPSLVVPEQREAPAMSLATVAGGGEGKRRILIADDYAVTRELVCQLLTGDNIEVDQATCGSEALMALQDHDYELILMDCSMPELDGMEVTRRLRAQGCSIPIVALTAHIDSRVVNACQAAGMNDYLAKPFRRMELLHMVDKWLNMAGEAVDGNAGR
jgi:signal transduction histidine kinase/DNA-binding response OmpR family regulator